MRISFVGIGAESMAIGCLAAIARRQGHEVSLAYSQALFDDRYNLCIPSVAKIFDDQDECIRQLIDQKPDVIACSALTSTYRWYLEVCREAKKVFPNVKVVFGGVHPSAVPDVVMEEEVVDYCCVGEGEVAFPTMLDALESGDFETPIPNMHFRGKDGQIIKGPNSGFVQNLDDYPWFDKEIWEEHVNLNDIYMTMATRGCPYRCTFCFNNFFAELPDKKSKYVRTRSLDDIMAELRYAKERYNPRLIDFLDDIFTINKKFIREFTERYKKEINIPFACLTHPKYMDDEMAEMLADAGCTYVQMGVQTMDEEFKYRELRRYEQGDHVKRAMAAMLKYDLKPLVDHMFGLPGEPITAQETSRTFYAEYTPARIGTYWTCFLPGTQLMNEAIADGSLSQEAVDKINRGIDFDFFRNYHTVKDPGLMRTYQSYEFIFRIMPMLPKRWRSKLKPDTFNKVPKAVLGMVNTIMDIANGLTDWNPYHVSYMRHYLFQMRNFMRRKMGMNVKPATKILQDVKPEKPERLKVSA